MRFYQHEKHQTRINNVLETFQIQAGLHGDILAQPRQIQYTDSTWISNLINAMYHFSIKLIRPTPFTIQHQRKNDICIMEVVLQKKLSKQTSRQINTCRQYLRIITLSDILDQDGLTIKSDILNHHPNGSKLNWPYIIQPNPKAWKVWDTFILNTFRQSSNTNVLQYKYRQQQ